MSLMSGSEIRADYFTAAANMFSTAIDSVVFTTVNAAHLFVGALKSQNYTQLLKKKN